MYYDAWAATWEKAAFMKARPVAGDLEFGWHVIRSIDPMIYRSSMDLAGVAAMREMKQRIEDAKGRVGATFNVKLGSGGIRDIEFVCQALQLLHGGRMPQVRDRSTQAGARGAGGGRRPAGAGMRGVARRLPLSAPHRESPADGRRSGRSTTCRTRTRD